MARRGPTSIAALLADIQRRPQVYFPALGRGSAGRTAQAATYLNYAPQFEALAALLSGAAQTRRTGVQSARRSGLAGSQGIQHIRDSYVEGLGQTLGDLGGPVATDAPARSPEARAAQGLGLSGTALAGMLSSMAAQQVAGIGNQEAALNRQYSSAADEIGSKLTGLFGQAGAYNTQQYESLAGQARKARAAERKAAADQRIRLMTAGINPDTGQYDPTLDAPREPKDPGDHYGYTNAQWAGMTVAQKRAAARKWKEATGTGSNSGPKLPNGEKPVSRSAHNSLSQSIDYVRSHRSLFEGSSRRDMVETLRTGITNKDAGIDRPGWYLEPIKNDLAISAGLDLIQFGHVTNGTARRLHSRGYSVKMLGLPNRSKRRRPSSGGTGSATGNAVGTGRV